MHTHNKETCKEHYCDNCLYVSLESNQEPCCICNNNIHVLLAKNCFWEKNPNYENEQNKYIITLLEELMDNKQRLEAL